MSSEKSSHRDDTFDSKDVYADKAAGVSPTGQPEPGAQRRATEDLPRVIAELAGEQDPGAADGGAGGEEPAVTDRAVIIGRDGRWVAGWALRFIILVAAGAILLKGIGLFWVALLPAILALIICTVLWPPVKWLRDHKFPSAAATITVILGAFAVFGGVIGGIAPSIAHQVPEMIDRATEGVRRLQEWVQGPPLNVELGEFNGVLDQVTGFVQERGTAIATGVFTGLSSASSAAVTLLVTFVLVFFFLKDGTKFLPWMRTLTGGNAGWHLTEVLSRTWNTLAGFVRAQALVSFVDAIFIGIGLVVLKVPLALALAVVTFFAGFIPIVGAVSAGAISVLLALVSNGTTNALLVLGLIILVQQLEGNVLSPIIQSKAMNLHAAIVLLAVTIGSTLFGIVGAFLAVPVAATLAVWLRYHSEMVALRAGEITVDDIKIATAQGETMTAHEGFTAVRDHLAGLTTRKDAGAGAPATAVKASELLKDAKES